MPITTDKAVIHVLGEGFQVVPQHAPVVDLTGRRDIALIEAGLAGMEVRL